MRVKKRRVIFMTSVRKKCRTEVTSDRERL
jgi:hypothetical protein